MKTRVVRTASGARAVQVVRYLDNKRIVLQHIGSAHTEEALTELMMLAEEWIKDHTSQLSIFPDENPSKLLHLNHSTFVGIKYRFFHTQVRAILEQIKLDDLPAILSDLVRDYNGFVEAFALIILQLKRINARFQLFRFNAK
ncbi:MAG: hypothetical protein H3C41_00645 [Bacteroidales bacterium]|nr:hypothetical protein [Bacteroidales bacterium]